MKRVLIVFLVVAFCVVCSGCFNTDLAAPINRNVRLMHEDEPASYQNTYKNWYLLAGLLPIWTVQPEEIIEQQQLTEVRVKTEDTVSDGVITFITAMIFLGIYPQTVVVEGNPGPKAQSD